MKYCDINKYKNKYSFKMIFKIGDQGYQFHANKIKLIEYDTPKMDPMYRIHQFY